MRVQLTLQTAGTKRVAWTRIAAACCLVLASCTPPEDERAPPVDAAAPSADVVELPTCAARRARSAKPASRGSYQAGVSRADPDPRVGDPDVAWSRTKLLGYDCACCHRGTVGGPGSRVWDLDFSPLWIDSASDRILKRLAGLEGGASNNYPGPDKARFVTMVEKELARRAAARP